MLALQCSAYGSSQSDFLDLGQPQWKQQLSAYLRSRFSAPQALATATAATLLMAGWKRALRPAKPPPVHPVAQRAKRPTPWRSWTV